MGKDSYARVSRGRHKTDTVSHTWNSGWNAALSGAPPWNCAHSGRPKGSPAMDAAAAAAPAAAAEEGLPPPPTAETTGLLGSGGGANDDEDPTAAATEPTRLLVRQITGEQTVLHLSLDDTVGALKEALRAEWGIEADAQRLLLSQTAVAAEGDVEAGRGEGGLPLEEDETATLRACKLADGAELLLTLQDAAQGAARRELRETARREAAERAEAERELAAERAELSALRGAARIDRRNALKQRPIAELTEPQREFLSREARRECLRRSWLAPVMLLVVLVANIYQALLVYATSGCGGAWESALLALVCWHWFAGLLSIAGIGLLALVCWHWLKFIMNFRI
eukprot:COSAG02_NODE_958_length_15648_cov_5.487620_9_plen_341_part_00